MHESFLRHRDFLYLKWAAALCVLTLLAYVWHEPLDRPNGGTWLGYTLGALGALLIVWLAWLGVRKRQYRGRGTVKGWVSAHVYLGLALLLIATLHTGFQFGLNIHTLAYALMVLVILSGVYGVLAYARYPREITENRAQASREAWLEELMDLNERAIREADAIDPEVHRLVLHSAERLRIGGSWQQQLLGTRAVPGDEEVALIGERLSKKLGASAAERDAASEQMILLSTQAITLTERDPQVERLKHLLELLTRRNELAGRLNRDIQAHAWLQVWLYFHVPLTVALLAALTAHIVAVFLYW